MDEKYKDAVTGILIRKLETSELPVKCTYCGLLPHNVQPGPMSNRANYPDSAQLACFLLVFKIMGRPLLIY